MLSRGHHVPWENVSILSPGLTLCALSVVVIIILVVVNGCMMFSCLSRNWLFFKHTHFLLPGLLLWPGWPGIAQLCQVFPSSVTWGARACREVNENSEPEGGKDLPARHQGMSHTLIVEFGCVFHLRQRVYTLSPTIAPHITGGGCIQTARYAGCVCCATYLLLTHQHNPMTLELNIKWQRPT